MVLQARYGETKKDAQGFLWRVNLEKSTRYPNGMFNKVVFESSWGSADFVRYNQNGDFIAGNPSLA